MGYNARNDAPIRVARSTTFGARACRQRGKEFSPRATCQAHHELVGGIGKGDAKLVEWLRSQLINITIIAAPMHNTPESINA